MEKGRWHFVPSESSGPCHILARISIGTRGRLWAPGVYRARMLAKSLCEVWRLHPYLPFAAESLCCRAARYKAALSLTSAARGSPLGTRLLTLVRLCADVGSHGESRKQPSRLPGMSTHVLPVKKPTLPQHQRSAMSARHCTQSGHVEGSAWVDWPSCETVRWTATDVCICTLADVAITSMIMVPRYILRSKESPFSSGHLCNYRAHPSRGPAALSFMCDPCVKIV